MGLIRRIARKVKKGLDDIKDEANHPGRPAGHRESENPYWEKPEDKPPADEKTSQKSDFWFLDGDNDGWDDTNPTDDKE